MSYANIHWVKLEKRLLNDFRFYSLSENSQLLYLKLLMLAADTGNKIPKDMAILKSALRSSLEEDRLEECVAEIQMFFPKFKSSPRHYSFGEWSNRTNWILNKDNSKGTPKVILLSKPVKDELVNVYCEVKGYTQANFSEMDWPRLVKRFKELYLRSDGKVDECVEAIRWIGAKNYEWTLETLLKKYPDFLKEKKSDKVKELERLVK